MQKKVYLIAALAVLLLLSACTAAQDETPAAPAVVEAVTDAEMAAPVEEAMVEVMDEANTEQVAAGDRPAWQLTSLTNARTGESFTLADFAGKTIFVEPMATWCSNCRRQLSNVRSAREQVAADEVVFVALSVETNIGDGDLANYANSAGFDWVFAVATPELLQQLVDEFGRSVTNPPATPHFIIAPDGSFGELVTGIEPADQILAQIAAAQG